MTGLNLESWLHLLRADLGAWVSLGIIALLLGLMAWTSWGSRRALRKCLVLSIAAHFGLALYGSTIPIVMQAFHPTGVAEPDRERIQKIQVARWGEGETPPRAGAKGERGHGPAAYDRPRDALALAETKVAAVAPAKVAAEPVAPAKFDLPAETAAPDVAPASPADPEPRQVGEPEKDAPDKVAAADPNDVAEAVKRRVESEPEPVALPPASPRLRAPSDRTRGPAPVASPLPEIPKVAAPPFKEQVEARPSAPAVDPPPSSLVELKGADVAAPEMTPGRPASPGLALSDPNLRNQARRTRSASADVALGKLATSPPLAVDPTALALRSGPAPALEGPREKAPASGDAPSRLAVADPAESGVNTAVERRAAVGPRPRPGLPDRDVRRPSRPAGRVADLVQPRLSTTDAGALALARVTPNGGGRVAGMADEPASRPWRDVPEVYRTRLGPNRTVVAQRAGASAESEQAVERALDWLKRHQDEDGRWDAGAARFDDGTIKKGDDSFTKHCPPGETCFGECLYWEADTAMTGLALLAYLGAGYTHADGKYSATVGKGLAFLIREQKADGDLRGPSRAVGMYCHAMATIALCEAYSLTGDKRLRRPVEKAVAFLVRARARDGMSWRYAPNSASGDTNVLGWAAMALKSAKIAGVAVPPSMQTGVLAWLDLVSAGRAKGLARYLPGDPPKPTMTAAAWVCRQFLGVGGPGPASTEAAESLLAHAPDDDNYDLYYWYYGTLALYQHGGEPWERWNSQARDQIVRRQRARGHLAGSWDPDDSQYGKSGGRVYCTALATLSLEVYYRFLRLYDDPKTTPPRSAEAPPRRPLSRP